MGKFKKWIWVLASLHLLALCIYIFVLRSYIAEAYQGTAPSWLMSTVEAIYPRFFTEQHRFSLDFFLHKADQIIWRYGITLVLVFSFFYIKNRNRNTYFQSAELSSKEVFMLRLAWAGIAIWIAHDWVFILSKMTFASAFYQPISLYRLYPHFPNLIFIKIVWGLWLLSTLLSLWKWKPTFFTTVSVVLFLFQQGFLWGFHKLDHTWASFNYASMLMPFLVNEMQKQTEKQPPNYQIMSLQWIQLSIAWVYLQAGIEKVLVGGWSWFNPKTFQTFLLTAQTDGGLIIAQSDFLCIVLPILAVVFELFFVVAIFFRRLLAFVLISGVLFHLGTYWLLGAGGVFSTWVLVYVFFIPNFKSKILKTNNAI